MNMLKLRTQRILKILIRPRAVLLNRGRNRLNAGVVINLHCLSLKNTQKDRKNIGKKGWRTQNNNSRNK